MSVVNFSKISLHGTSGYGHGYGHLSRLISFGRVLETETRTCLHGVFEPTEEFVNMTLDAKNLLECKCQGKPNLIIFDSYDPTILKNSLANYPSRVVQLVDELSPEVMAEAYIEVSPTKLWKPLNSSAKILKFNDSPFLRREFFTSLDKKSYIDGDQKKVLVLIGSSKSCKEIIKDISEIFSRRFPDYSLYIAATDLNLASYAQSLDFTIINYDNNFLELISQYHLVISAAGVTAWELLSLQCNMLLIATANNQNLQLEYMSKNFQIPGLHFISNSYKYKINLESLVLSSIKYSKKNRGISVSKVNDGAMIAANWLKQLGLLI
jgi:spore coat polysaccharide biosynthesis predicted glycosyltransferase SpsG